MTVGRFFYCTDAWFIAAANACELTNTGVTVPKCPGQPNFFLLPG